MKLYLGTNTLEHTNTSVFVNVSIRKRSGQLGDILNFKNVLAVYTTKDYQKFHTCGSSNKEDDPKGLYTVTAICFDRQNLLSSFCVKYGWQSN